MSEIGMRRSALLTPRKRFALASRLRALALTSSVLGGALLVGCKAHDADTVTTCSVLADLCHPFDDGGVAEAFECHEIGHRGSTEECAAKMEHCRSVCRYYDPCSGTNPLLVVPADGGELTMDGGGSPVDASVDAADAEPCSL